MGGNYSMLYEPTSTGTLTSAQYVAEHQNHIDNMTPDGVDDASVNATAMQTTADPYPEGSESLPTDLRGEIQRIRYLLKQLGGGAYWYSDPAIDMANAAASLGHGYSNLVAAWASASTITMTADKIVVGGRVKSSLNLTLDITDSGENGLDTGVEANSAWYSLWCIYNPTSDTFSGLISASETSPTMPSGFTYKRRIGFFYNNSSGDIDNFRIFNDIFTHWKDVASGGERSLAGTPTASAWTDHTIGATLAPSLELEILLGVNSTSGVGGAGITYLRAKGSSISANAGVEAAIPHGANASDVGRFWMMQNSSRVIQYFCDTNVSTLYILVFGFRVPPAF